MKITFLGTGTSHGIPVIGCDCAVCKSPEAKDKRNRCSLYIQSGEGSSGDTALLVDTGPEFRSQCITYGVRRLDAVFITHPHADHLHGIDDLRIFSYRLREEIQHKYPVLEPLPIYCNPQTRHNIEYRFDYIFTPVKEGGGKPNLQLRERRPYQEFSVGPFDIQSAPVMHGSLESSGWIFREVRFLNAQGEGFRAAKDRNVQYDCVETALPEATEPHDPPAAARGVAYLTDCSFVSDETITASRGVEHLIIDGLRKTSHNTHFSFEQALECAEKIQPRHVWLIHMNHEMSHRQIDAYLQDLKRQFPHLSGIEIHPAYDGQVIQI